ncbi:MAG: sodium:solute symporter family protein [Firmicutes bacterium]|nr:sodium:solute symporter family protein [Bacillota bacterium]
MNIGVIVAVVIYELIVILGCAAFLKVKEKKMVAAPAAGDEDFALGGRNMGVIVLAPTIALTVLGSAHITGVFEMSYGMGAIAIWFSLAHVIMIVVACFGTGAWVRRLGATTVPQVIKDMYGPGVAIAISCVMAGQVWGVLTLECQGLGIVISSLTGWDISKAVILGGILGILYVVFAGMKQVGAVNVINATVMYIGLIIATIYVASKLPGGNFDFIEKALPSSEGGAEFMLSIFGNADLMITFAVGNVIAVTFCQSISQMLMQTMMSAKDEKTIKKSVWLAAPLNGMFGVFAVILGLAARSIPEYAAYGAKLAATNMLVDMLPMWMSALLLAALLAAILSTFAMTSLTTATIWTHDIYKGYINPDADEKKLANITRIMIIILALAALAVSVALPTILNAINWVFAWIVPVFWIVVFGLFWKRNSKVAGLALAVSWILNVLWSLTPLPAAIGGFIGGLTNPYVTLIVSLVILIIGNLASKGEPGYFKAMGIKAED